MSDYIIRSTAPAPDPLMQITRPEPWVRDALCAQTGGDEFFAEGKGKSYMDARKICLACPVQAQCLEYALRNNEQYGLWGGATEQERTKMRKRVTNHVNGSA